METVTRLGRARAPGLGEKLRLGESNFAATSCWWADVTALVDDQQCPSNKQTSKQPTNKLTNKVHATSRPLLWASAQWPLRGNKQTHATPASDRQTYTFLLVAAFQSRGFDRGRGAPRLPKHNVKQRGSPWKRAEIQKTQRCANDMTAKAPPTRR